MKFQTRKYLKNLTGIDLFGHTIGVNFRDSQTFDTKLSAVVSFVTLSFMMINLAFLLIAFQDGSRQEETTTFIQVDRFDSKPYNLAKNKFEIAIYPEKPELFDPELNQFTVYQYKRCSEDDQTCNNLDRLQ